VATSWDVAREAGVSQATVSRVLNEDPRVAEPTRARVLDVVRRLNYTPNAIARGLVSRRTTLVGVVVSDIVNPFYPQLLEAIAERLDDRGLKMVLFNAYGREEDAYAKLLLEQRVDGIILTAAIRGSAMVRQLVEHGLPVVLTNRHDEGVSVDRAVGDNQAGAATAAAHLRELGHDRIAVITGHPDASTSDERLEGFRRGLADLGSAVDDDLVLRADFQAGRAYDITLELLARPDRPTAIFALNDLMAFGVLNAAAHAGVEVPRQLSVMGFDDVWMAGWERFNLTTVHQPLAEMARSSVDLLTERMGEPTRSVRKLVFPSTLVVRGTTAPPPAVGRRGKRSKAKVQGKGDSG
jgi:LacI family transcriptional regulator